MKITAPQYVKPFVRRQKNDSNDAAAICTALQQPNMRFVPKKTLDQQDVQALHRARQRQVNRRTANEPVEIAENNPLWRFSVQHIELVAERHILRLERGS